MERRQVNVLYCCYTTVNATFDFGSALKLYNWLRKQRETCSSQSERRCRLSSQSNTQTCNGDLAAYATFSRAWQRLHVFPRLFARVWQQLHFPRAYQRLRLICPRLAADTVTCFPALISGYLFLYSTSDWFVALFAPVVIGSLISALYKLITITILHVELQQSFV